MLSLSFAVIPGAVVPAFTRAHRGIDTFNQATLAQFMRQGLLAPHIGRMCTEYSHRRDALQAALSHHDHSIRPT